MEATKPFAYRHVREDHSVSVVRNLNRASVKLNSQNRRSRECYSECPSECPSESQRQAVHVYAVEDDFWCLRCAFFTSDDQGRYRKQQKFILSSAKENDMDSRLAHFNMTASSFETKEEAEKFALNFKDVVETFHSPLGQLDAWSQHKALAEAKKILSTMYASGVFSMLIISRSFCTILHFTVRYFFIKQY